MKRKLEEGSTNAEQGELLNLLATRVPPATLRNVLFNELYFNYADLRILSQVNRAWRAIVGPLIRGDYNSFHCIAYKALDNEYWNLLEWILRDQKLDLHVKKPFCHINDIMYQGRESVYHAYLAEVAARAGQTKILKQLDAFLPQGTRFHMGVICNAIASGCLDAFKVCFKNISTFSEADDLCKAAIRHDFFDALVHIIVNEPCPNIRGWPSTFYLAGIISEAGKEDMLISLLEFSSDGWGDGFSVWNDRLSMIMNSHPNLEPRLKELIKK